jgi:hypothetical protein
MKPERQSSEEQEATITRQEALRKMGKYAAATAAGTFLMLSPKHAQADTLGPQGRPGNNGASASPAEYNRTRNGGYNSAGTNYQSRTKEE